ncbi:LemA family protein [uncultured Desulfosarcina sp.]|uniref:LemA family protein n=1 Tax=uncultured Desulfosarcina sp. TaxID=218289 RepID=UPI0029C6D4E6|nr:LemA family protein [uncultured Desulfosarcina sp.]
MNTKITLLLAASFIAIVAIFGVALILVHNGIVDADKRVEEAEAQIGAVCQRRLDLMPNLIETVKAYAAHEKSVLTAVTEARAHAQNTLDRLAKDGYTPETMKALETSQAQVTSSIRGIFALVENYPDLKASTNFLALQDQFEGTENRISVARQRFNSAVRSYNSKIEKFPGVLIAPIFGYQEAEYFEAKEEAYEPVKAKF